MSTNEGTRGFAITLQQINEGQLHAEMGEELQKLAGELNEHAIKYGRDARGTLTLTLALMASPNGTVHVGGEVKAKGQKIPKVPSVFWLTKGNNLTLDNPKQQKLPLRDVTAPKGEARDLSASPAVREVGP